MADGRKQHGMQTFEQHVAELVEAGLITPGDRQGRAGAVDDAGRARPKRGSKARRPDSRPVPTLDDTLRRLLPVPREAGTPAAARRPRGWSPSTSQSLGYRSRSSASAFIPPASWRFPCSAPASAGWPCSCFRCCVLPTAPPGRRSSVLALGARPPRRCSRSASGSAGSPLGGAPREDANLIATRGGGPVAALDRRAPRHQGAGAVHGGPAGRGLGRGGCAERRCSRSPVARLVRARCRSGSPPPARCSRWSPARLPGGAGSTAVPGRPGQRERRRRRPGRAPRRLAIRAWAC